MKKQDSFMRKIVLLIILFTGVQAFGQSELSFGIGASSIIDFDFQRIHEYKTSYTTVNSYFPMKVGADVMWRIAPNYSIITGYSFLYRYMEVNMYTSTVDELFYGYKMYTSEIPLLFRYDGILKKDHFSFFIELGGNIGFMYAQQNIFGRYKERPDFIGTATWGYFYTMNLPSGPIPAIQGGIGFNNTIGETRGMLEVGISYNYQVPKKISNEFDYYYQDGVGNTTKEDYNFNTRSTYLALSLKYHLPFKIKLSNDQKNQ
jgi:hypothetical protein